MLGVRWRWAAFPLVALGLGGCAVLDTVTPACGNGVVESGEDCDQKDDTTSGDACGQPGTIGACRFVCSTTIACPAGWACGIDGVCRNPIPLQWTSTGVLVPESSASDLLVSDFDSDGVDDVVAVAPPSVDLHFFETSRTSTVSTSLIDSEPGAAVGHLTTSTSAVSYGPSLTLDLSRGLGVFNGETDRSLSPVVYATATFPGQQYQLAAYLVGSSDVPSATMPMPTGFFTYGSGGVNTFTPPSGAPTPIDAFTANQTPVGNGAVGRFLIAQGCDWFALALNDTLPSQGHVRVYSPCAATPLVDDVLLPLGRSAAACEKAPCGTAPATNFHPLRLYDVNGDGLSDLVLAAADTALHVAYSYGDGHFGSTPPTTPPSPADDRFSPAFANLTLGNGVPLAIGDVNGDGILDIVDPTGIYLGASDGTSPLVFSSLVAAPDSGRTWSEAVIADLNGDGFVDVAVGSSDYPGITLYRGNDTALFNPVDIVTSAGIEYLEVGDFDGDFVNDLIFSAIGVMEAGSTTPPSDTLYISFGVEVGPPADPVAIGDVSGVTQIVPAYESLIDVSLISDAFVVGMDAATMGADVYLFPGATSRQIETPYFLLPASTTAGAGALIDGPRRSVVGKFSGRAGAGDADIAVFAKPFDCVGVCNARLWLLPTQGGGAIEAASTSNAMTPFPTALTASTELVDDALLGNLGPPPGSDLDELVVVAATSGGSVVVTGSAAGDGTFAFGAEANLADFYITPVKGFLAAIVDAKLLTADVNGDGHLDLVLASPTSGLAVMLGAAEGGLSTSTTPPPLSYAELDAACPTSALLGPAPGGMSVMPGTITIGAAAFSAGSDKKQALVIVVGNGAVLVRYDGGALTTTCLTTGATTSVATGSAVAVGDFDGDGIEDIVVSQSSGLDVYYGDSYAPGQKAATDGGAP